MFYTTDVKYFQKVTQHQGYFVGIRLWCTQTLSQVTALGVTSSQPFT